MALPTSCLYWVRNMDYLRIIKENNMTDDEVDTFFERIAICTTEGIPESVAVEIAIKQIIGGRK